MLTLLLALTASLGADGYVAVDRGAWLYAQPKADARRLRVAEVEEAPDHTPTPVVVLREVDRQRGWVEVRPLNIPPSITDAFHARGPDATPTSWPHCYPPPVGLAQLDTPLWVRASDLLPVLTNDTFLTTDEGGSLKLTSGLVLTGGSTGVYRVRGHHVEVTARVPASAVSDRYTLPGPRVVDGKLLLEGASGQLTEAHPQLRLRVAAHDTSVQLRTPAVAQVPDGDVLRLHDRCIEIVPEVPIAELPVNPDIPATRWPVYVPEGTVVTWSDGQGFGTVRGGQMPLWDRGTCTWTQATGMCCAPHTGLELQDPSVEALGLCFDAQFPDAARVEGLGETIAESARRHADKLASIQAADRSLSWSIQEVRGSITVEDVLEPVSEVESLFDYCYLQGLKEDPALEGTLHVVLRFMPTGRVHQSQATWDKGDDEVTADCVSRALSKIIVLNQIGQEPSQVTFRFQLDQ